MPNTHYRSTRVPRHSTKITGRVVVAFLVSSLALVQFGNSAGQASETRPHILVTLIAKRTVKPARPSKAVAASREVIETASVAVHPTPTTRYVVSLIKKSFPPMAWHAAETVAWCESKFHPLDIHFDSNGTHDRGLFQLNDGGTEQYLLQRLGFNPNNIDLAFNPVLNVRAAALLYARDGWSQWSCASAL